MIELIRGRLRLPFCWLLAIKKIFSAVLRMNSNPCINEILADARVKSANADEIFGFALDEIKSTHRRSDFTRRRRISYCEAIFHPPARVDLVEKAPRRVLFLVRSNRT